MNTSEILIYQNQNGHIKIDVRLEDETVWLTQDQMATLFGKGRSTITEHIANVFSEGELMEDMVCRKFRHTAYSYVHEGLDCSFGRHSTTQWTGIAHSCRQN